LHCFDDYYVSLEIKDLRDREAFLASTTNGEELPKFGFPLRLAMPRKYGYQWAKWVHRLEVVTDDRKGCWANLGLSDPGGCGRCLVRVLENKRLANGVLGPTRTGGSTSSP
jgi:DMSO/TMAO reductase YedYZ molybdopterin-dependent catalytic subunit